MCRRLRAVASLVDLRAAFLAGRLAAVFLVALRAVFFAVFLAGDFFAAFLVVLRAVFLAAFFAVFLVAFLAVDFRAVDFFAAVFLADFLAAFFAVRLVVALRAVDFFAAVFLADFLAAFLVALRAVDFLAAFFAVFLADFFAVRAVVVFRDELAAAWVSFGVTSSSVAGTRASCSRPSHPLVDVFTEKDRRQCGDCCQRFVAHLLFASRHDMHRIALRDERRECGSHGDHRGDVMSHAWRGHVGKPLWTKGSRVCAMNVSTTTASALQRCGSAHAVSSSLAMRSRMEEARHVFSGGDTHEVLHGVDVDICRHRRGDDDVGVDR